jgi:HAD superfamily hydrolase (TIGR01509 family)
MVLDRGGAAAPPAELVIFDNDGVIVDSELLANQVLADLLTKSGHPTTVEECIRDHMGGTLAGVRASVRARTGQELPASLEDDYHQRLFDDFTAHLRPVPGVAAVLEDLTLPFCLASSGTRDRIVRSLTITGLLGYFGDRIFSAEQVAHGKPAPDLFLHAAAALATPADRCVVIEDSPKGVAAARAAGMRVLGYAALTPADKLAAADAIFTTMDDLLPLLGQAGVNERVRHWGA